MVEFFRNVYSVNGLIFSSADQHFVLTGSKKSIEFRFNSLRECRFDVTQYISPIMKHSQYSSCAYGFRINHVHNGLSLIKIKAPVT